MDLKPINDAEYCRKYLESLTLSDERAERALDGYNTLVHSLDVLTTVVAQLPQAYQRNITSKITVGGRTARTLTL